MVHGLLRIPIMLVPFASIIAAGWLWTTPGAVPQAPAEYVGEAACLSCHESYGYQATVHASAQNPRTPAATHGCESCHGPGKPHVERSDPSAIRNPASMPVTDSTAVCTACHEHVAHAEPGRACSACHSVHHAAGSKLLKKR